MPLTLSTAQLMRSVYMEKFCIVGILRDPKSACAWIYSDVPRIAGTYLPDKSVTCTNVSLNDAKMWATPNTFSPSGT